MSDERDLRDPRDRPPDPAGTQPKFDPASLLPAPIAPGEPMVDADVVEEPEDAPAHDGGALVPRPAGAMAPAAAVESPHAPRFQFLLGALLALGAVAVIATLAVALRGSSTGDAGASTWSPWRPTSGDPVGQIAAHVAPEYRLSDGAQLVAVTGGPLQVAGLPMQIALRDDPAHNGDISLLSGKGVLYRLCGLGPKCAIDRGKPSQQRHLLLRREALELALYTFRYVDGVDQVVVFMPPRRGLDPSQALLFRHGDVAPELARPLRATLVRRTPSVTGVTTSPDAGLVNRITEQTLYTFSLTQANQDARVFLVLEPFSAATGSGSSGAAPATTTTTPGATKTTP